MLKTICLLAVLALPSPALAGKGEDHAGDIKRVENYLNGIRSIVAEFTQVAPDGNLTGGKFFLKRPGKMRWQYDPPTPVLMIADGKQFVYYDYELEQVNYIPLDASLATFLAQEHIDLSDNFVQVEEFKKTPGMMRLTFSQTNKPEAGKLTLEFSDTPLQLRNMVVTDAQQQVTTVSLNNARYGVDLENKLFIFKDPREGRRRN